MGYYPGQAHIWHFPQRQGVASLLCSPSMVERQLSKWWGSIEPLKPSWADSVIFLYLCVLICTQGYLCLNNRGICGMIQNYPNLALSDHPTLAGAGWLRLEATVFTSPGEGPCP